MLHVLAGYSKVNHSTTNRANIASLCNGGGAIGAEASVQQRFGLAPTLIGALAVEEATPTVNECKITLNTWNGVTDYIELAPLNLVEIFGDMDPWKIGEWATSSEADWDFDFESTGGTNQFLTVYLSYGQRHPYKGGKVIWRKGSITSGSYSTTATYGTATNITDLDPAKMYRIHYLGGLGGANSGMLRLTSKDFNGMCIQAIVPSTYYGGVTFHKDSLICSGLGTSVSVESTAEGETAGEYLIGFEEYGGSNVASALPQTGVAGVTDILSPVSGTSPNILSSLFG